MTSRGVRIPFAKTKKGRPIAAWLLKTSPKEWDFFGYADHHFVVRDWWMNDNYRVGLMQEGQPCVLWVTGSERDDHEPGIWAAGIIGRMSDSEHDPASHRKDRIVDGKRRPYVPVKLTILPRPITRSDVAANAKFKSAEILVQQWGSNPFVLTPDELEIVAESLGDRAALLKPEGDARTVPSSVSKGKANKWGDGYADMVHNFVEAGIAVPPIPHRFRPKLRRLGPWVWSTRPIDPMTMYLFGEYIVEALEEEMDDYVAVSHWGHGMNSYGLNYHLMYRGLALFTQDGWGGVYMDPVDARAEIAETFATSRELIDRVEQAPSKSDSRWLFVAASRLRREPRFQILEGAGDFHDADRWIVCRNLRELLDRASDDMWGSRDWGFP